MKTLQLFLAGIILIIAPTARAAESTAGKTGSPPIPAGTPADFVAHEWGTFSSVSGSDGVLLSGMEREEESLPRYVYSHYGMGSARFKGFNSSRPIASATVKLETPVIYFYHDEPLDLHVSVGFVGGSISQWYPNRSGGETVPEMKFEEGKVVAGGINFAEPYLGGIEWKIRSMGRGEATNISVLKTGDTPNWIRPRWPDSNIVRNEHGEKEKYLFYRGVGNFQLPLRTQFDNGDSLRLSSTVSIPFALVYHMKESGESAVLWKGRLGEDQTDVTIPVSTASYAQPDGSSESIYMDLATALVEAGLFEVEADAMLRTWWTSYFGKPGIRVFWIVPPEFTDEILPITIDPAPRELKRVLLGRSEILAPGFEDELLTEFHKEEKENRFTHHPLVKAFGERVAALEKAAATKTVSLTR